MAKKPPKTLKQHLRGVGIGAATFVKVVLNTQPSRSSRRRSSTSLAAALDSPFATRFSLPRFPSQRSSSEHFFLPTTSKSPLRPVTASTHPERVHPVVADPESDDDFNTADFFNTTDWMPVDNF